MEPCKPLPCGNLVLSEDALHHFEEKGWCVLRGALAREVAISFTENSLLPAIAAAGVDPESPEQWHVGEKWHVIFDKSKANNNKDGAHVGLQGGGVEPPSMLFAESGRLRGALHDLLASPGLTPENEASPLTRSDALRYLPPETSRRIAGVVLRYPHKARPTWAERWFPHRYRLMGYLPWLGWHVDGAGWHHYLHSRQCALVMLLVFGIGTLEPGFGMTSVVSGSHLVVARLLKRRQGLAYMTLFLVSHIISLLARVQHFLPRCFCCKSFPQLTIDEVAPCEPGDVLFLHPFLVHSSTENVYGQSMRIATNIHVGWTDDIDLDALKKSGSAASRVERAHLAAVLT
eukprot:TRINITY_DN45946_c0_g1_i1.p1 TRINITY_DN45946_c0_g1~~TRINITY_DN45946_c0_g1_i1.p1  ORF type:complete len:357 (+),score=33.76 TRINITY_DN45946_c0_g1_i1:39-1073(+)